MIKYSIVKKNGLISEEILKSIPQYCKCGSEYEFTDNLVNICCSNRYCYLKIGNRLASMCKLLGIDGLGERNCAKIAETFKLKSPAQLYIIAQQELECKGVANFQTKLKEFKMVIDEKEITLWEYVKFMSLPGIDNNAKPLFDGYNDIVEYYKNLEKFQISFISDRLGLSLNADNSVLAVNVYNILMAYKNELITCSNFFHIKEKMGRDVTICITGGVRGYTNKGEFIRSLQVTFGDKLNIIQQSSVSAKTNFLVCEDSSSRSNKVQNVMKINTKAGKEVVKFGTSGDCYNYLESLWESC